MSTFEGLVEGKGVPRGVNLESDLDLGDSTGCGGDAVELELSEVVVVARHGALSLVDRDKDGRLCGRIGWVSAEDTKGQRWPKKKRTVVGGGREDLGLLCGDDGVAGDELGEDTASGLDT